MTTPVYHHTDSARLPWILHEQELRPGRNQIGGLPRDFLWATTDPMGDPTAAGAGNRDGYRDGKIAAVRFTLADEDFDPWDEMKSHPGWEPSHSTILESAAVRMGIGPKKIAQWRCRVDPLPSDRWIAIEYRTWRNPRWRQDPSFVTRVVEDGVLGVELDGALFCSHQMIVPGAPTAYAIKVIREHR